MIEALASVLAIEKDADLDLCVQVSCLFLLLFTLGFLIINSNFLLTQ